jgi:threonine dehydratase
MAAIAMAAITRADIARVHDLIRPFVRATPVIEVEAGALAPCPLTLKLELFQHTGSFKPRGAFANLLTRQVPAVGIAAASGGNHGAAVAFAARALGRPARIFVPELASPVKTARIAAYGAELVVGGASYAEALQACEGHIAAAGAMSVHAYDAPATLTGQGTVAKELSEQAPGLDTLLVAVGGGGLIGGCAAWYAGGVKLIGVESEGCPTLARALAAGRPVDVEVGGLAADALGARRVGKLCFALAQAHVADSLLVPDAAIRAAQRALWDTLRIVAEPGGATALAALASGAYAPAAGERVGVLICGGNTDPGSVA